MASSNENVSRVSPENFPHNGQWRGTWLFSVIYAWINSWVNTRETGELRLHRAHYVVIVMFKMPTWIQLSRKSLRGEHWIRSQHLTDDQLASDMHMYTITWTNEYKYTYMFVCAWLMFDVSPGMNPKFGVRVPLCLKNFDNFTRTPVRVSKMNAISHVQLTFEMLTLLHKYLYRQSQY